MSRLNPGFLPIGDDFPEPGIHIAESPFRAWAQMDRAQRQQTLQNMAARGGSFVQRLSVAWLMADEINAGKLARAFPELVSNYAPKE
jgi:hypothetical protein